MLLNNSREESTTLTWCCRPLEEGDIVNVDITVYYKGMHGDLNETFCCGQVSPEKQRLLQGAYLCLMEAVKAVGMLLLLLLLLLLLYFMLLMLLMLSVLLLMLPLILVPVLLLPCCCCTSGRICENVCDLGCMRTSQCKPGMMYRDVGRVVSSVADKYGYAFDLAFVPSAALRFKTPKPKPLTLL